VALHLTSQQRRQIKAHAESTYPHECCGLLLGELEPDGTDRRSLVEVWPTQNAWSAEVAQELSGMMPAAIAAGEGSRSQSDRYWIDPQELLAAQRYARDRSFSVIGIYHSHPDHPAVPSECDRVLAWSDYSYLIVSVHQGKAQSLLSWRLDQNHQFQSEVILSETILDN
jgi:proteasome lid subunit RPN8/RPN11